MQCRELSGSTNKESDMWDYDDYHEINENIDFSYGDLLLLFVFFLCWKFVEHKWLLLAVAIAFLVGLGIGLLF